MTMGETALAFSFLSSAAVLFFAWRAVGPVAPFLFANARVNVRSRYLIPEEKWDRLSKASSLEELVGLLEGTPYKEKLSQAKTVKEIHLALEKTFTSSTEELKEISPDVLDPLFDAYIMFWEAKILKAFYRARLVHQEVSPDVVFTVGNIDSSMLRALQSTQSLEDLKVVMSETPYEEVFSRNHSSLEEFEAELDNLVFKQFVEKVNKNRMYDRGRVLGLLNKSLDIQNLLVLLKLKARDVPEEKREKFLIKNHTPLFKRRQKLIKAESLEAFVQDCKGLPYYEPLSQALEKYKQDKQLSHFEHSLNRFFKKSMLEEQSFHRQGPYPIFSFFLKKELEMRNLITISKGVSSKMPPEKIKELLI